MDKVRYQQARRDAQLATMRTVFRLKQAAEAEEKRIRSARMAVLAEQAEARRALERAERRRIQQLELRDPDHPLCAIVTANTLGGREFSAQEIKALRPCGRFEQLQHHGLGHAFSLDVKAALAAGASLSDLRWVASALSQINPEAKRRYTLWQEQSQGRGQNFQLRTFVAIFSRLELPDEPGI